MPDPDPDDLVAYDLADWGPDLRAQGRDFTSLLD